MTAKAPTAASRPSPSPAASPTTTTAAPSTTASTTTTAPPAAGASLDVACLGIVLVVVSTFIVRALLDLIIAGMAVAPCLGEQFRQEEARRPAVRQAGLGQAYAGER